MRHKSCSWIRKLSIIKDVSSFQFIDIMQSHTKSEYLKIFLFGGKLILKFVWKQNGQKIAKKFWKSQEERTCFIESQDFPKTIEMKVWVCLRKTKCRKIKTDLGIYEHLIFFKKRGNIIEQGEKGGLFKNWCQNITTWKKKKDLASCTNTQKKLMLIVKHLSVVMTHYQPEACTPNVYMLSKLTRNKKGI